MPLSADLSMNRQETLLGALALVIVLHQFPRNIFRDSERSFASDAKALAWIFHEGRRVWFDLRWIGGWGRFGIYDLAFGLLYWRSRPVGGLGRWFRARSDGVVGCRTRWCVRLSEAGSAGRHLPDEKFKQLILQFFR